MPPTLAPREGHDWGQPNLGALGIFYMCAAAIYTTAVLFGLVLLCRRRREPAVRMRGLGLTIAVVLVLHFYSVFVLIVYPINGRFKCGLEFWIMGVIFPFGIALFQASNVRLLAYYKAQRSLASLCPLRPSKPGFPVTWKQLKGWWASLDFLQRTYAGIFVGLLVQLVITGSLFFGSRKFHSSYGLFSTHVDPASCRRGYEWIPSVFWQFAWSCIFGPYVLFCTKGINDTHYWAWQTRLAIIAAVPGTPLWMAFLYSNDGTVQEINKWFVPAGWFLPGLMTMQAVSIIFPLLHVRRSVKPGGPEKGLSHCRSWSQASSKNKNGYSMASLELQLERNIEPLLRWTAERDFTAENVLFLKAVRDLRIRWGPLTNQPSSSPRHVRSLYKESAMVFFTLVNPHTAPFNINIDYKTLKDMSAVFKDLEYIVADDVSVRSCASDNVVTPWLGLSPSQVLPLDVLKVDVHGQARFSVLSSSGVDDRTLSPFPLHAPNGLKIPPDFSVAVFDKAYETVKQDVFRNTWMRYEALFGKPRSISDFRGSVLGNIKTQYDWGKPWRTVRRATSQALSL